MFAAAMPISAPPKCDSIRATFCSSSVPAICLASRNKRLCCTAQQDDQQHTRICRADQVVCVRRDASSRSRRRVSADEATGDEHNHVFTSSVTARHDSLWCLAPSILFSALSALRRHHSSPAAGINLAVALSLACASPAGGSCGGRPTTSPSVVRQLLPTSQPFQEKLSSRTRPLSAVRVRWRDIGQPCCRLSFAIVATRPSNVAPIERLRYGITSGWSGGCRLKSHDTPYNNAV